MYSRLFLSPSGLAQCFAVLAIVFLVPTAAGAQSSAGGCAPSPKVKAALDKLPRADDEQVSKQIKEERLQRLRELLKKYPNDLFVHRQYQDVFGRDEDELTRVITEYQARVQKRPNDPASLYLYGRVLSRRSPEEALPIAQQALKLSPQFVWTHLLLTNLYYALDWDKARAHILEFLKLCPDAREGYSYVSLITDQQQLQTMAARLRARIQGKKDIDSVESYNQLWERNFAPGRWPSTLHCANKSRKT